MPPSLIATSSCLWMGKGLVKLLPEWWARAIVHQLARRLLMNFRNDKKQCNPYTPHVASGRPCGEGNKEEIMNQPLDSRQLRAFKALAERKSFTVAAKDLFLSQSAVSHSMKALEQEVGCRLLTGWAKRSF